jgi:hypothetical protein
MTTVTKSSKLLARWPSVLGLVAGGGASVLIVQSEGDPDLGPGVAAMMTIYLVAYAVGKPASAWLAFVAVFAVAIASSILGIEGATAMVVVLVGTWIWVLARGRARDGRWFTVQTLGMVMFGGLTIAAFLAGERGGVVLAGVGWFLHGLWDAYHFAKDRIVIRSWSELCAITDFLVGTMLVVVGLVR